MSIGRRGVRAAACAIAGAAALAPAAQAGTASTTLGSTATVQNQGSATVSAGSMPFGLYNPLGASPVDYETNLMIQATPGLAYSVGMSTGQNSITACGRRLKHSAQAAFLNYDIYLDSARTSVWGSPTCWSQYTSTGTGGFQNIPVYGRIPAGQAVPDGS